MAVETMLEDGFSLRKALDYSGCSRKMYYHKTIPRTFLPDPVVVEKVKQIALDRPTFGTRRMAAMLRRELHMPINRKRVRRIFHALNWIEPSKKKSDIIRSSSKLVKATRRTSSGRQISPLYGVVLTDGATSSTRWMSSRGSGSDTLSTHLR